MLSSDVTTVLAYKGTVSQLQIDRINKSTRQLSCGTSAAVALIVNNKLYVANVGDSRALLCKTDKHGVHKVIQLSVDHDLTNEDELLRLENIGLDLPKGGVSK